MSQSTPTTQETMTDLKGQETPQQEKDTFPTLCGPGCSCGAPGKVGVGRIVVMLIVIAVIAIALIYRSIS